jgi:hypothetical protein
MPCDYFVGFYRFTETRNARTPSRSRVLVRLYERSGPLNEEQSLGSMTWRTSEGEWISGAENSAVYIVYNH